MQGTTTLYRSVDVKKITLEHLVDFIESLGTSQYYNYYTGGTKFRIVEIVKPRGPIKFMRWNNDEREGDRKLGSISTHQLEVASAVFSKRPNYPIHFDRLYSGSGNTRAALESMLALTPQFFICYPLKTNPYTGASEKKLKHIMWCPADGHKLGTFSEMEYNQVITEIELDTSFGNIEVPTESLGAEFESIEAKKTHTQMQVALVRIGNALNFRSWIAKNDRSIKVDNGTLGELEGVINSLDKVKILYDLESKNAASLIDCIWFSGDFKFIPAVIEVEHSTGVTSGLTRILKLKETIPSINMNCTIVAPNELRDKVFSEGNNGAFKSLDIRYMPYSTVRELYGLIRRYQLKDVVERTFIEPFMEKVIEE
jgi:type II restriction enzyme